MYGNLDLESRIQLKKIRNPRSTDKGSGIHSVESTIQDCFGFPFIGLKVYDQLKNPT